MRLLALLLLALPASATVHCVGAAPTSPACGDNHAKSAAGLQAALDHAAAGDTIYVEEGTYTGAFYFRTNGSAGSPITVTSRKYDWLPCSTCRITPSHLPNMPMLATNTANTPALFGFKDGSGNPPKGWIFDGIAASVALQDRNFENGIITTGGHGQALEALGVAKWYAPDAAHSPDSITFNHIFVRSWHTDTYRTSNHIIANGSNITIKNSFLWPLWGSGLEIHGIAMFSGPGPTTLSNNFISAISIPIFTGGDAADYVGGGPANLTVEDNFIYRPWKWFPDRWDYGNASYCATIGVGGCVATSNPYPAHYTGNVPAPSYGCVKNLSEHKLIYGFALWRRNIHENNWMDTAAGFCEGQYFGFTITARKTGVENAAKVGLVDDNYWMDNSFVPPGGCVSPATSCAGSLTTSGTDFQWFSGMNIDYPPSRWINPGHDVCVYKIAAAVDTNYQQKWAIECRTVATITHLDTTGATWNTGTLVSAFSRDIDPSWSTTLSSNIDSSTLTIPVADASGIESWDIIRIEQEWALVCSKSGNTLTLCNSTYGFGGAAGRGVFGHTAASHSSGAPVSRLVIWTWVKDPDAKLENVTIENSIFRNVAAGFNILAKDRYGWAPEHNGGTTVGRISNFTLRNVLFHDTVPNFVHDYAIKFNPQEELSTNQGTTSGNNITLENLTFDWGTKGWHVIGFNDDGTPPSLHPLINNYRIRNNIFPDASCGDGNCYSLQMTSTTVAYNNWNNAKDYVSGTKFFGNNQFYAVSASSCADVTCTGNKADAFATNVQFHGNGRKVKSTAAVSKAGSDGSDMGVRADQLPQILNLKVTASSRTALLEFDLPGPIRDAGNTQPCMLEVSTSETIRSYIGSSGADTVPYTTIAALNPAYFKQPDQSTTTNPLLLAPVVSNGHVYWPIGMNNSSVTGDDGNAHDLRLAASTTYYGRLMCYADTQHFQFTTAAATSGASSIPMQWSPAGTVASVKVEYGATSSYGANVTQNVSGSASVSIPVTAGQHVYLRRSHYSGANATGTVLFQESTMVMP